MYDPRQFGERNPNSNDQPSRDERLLMNPLYADASSRPGQEDPPGNTAHEITNSFHRCEGVRFENRENENVYVENIPNAYEVPITRAPGSADTGEYFTLDNNSCYNSTLGPSTITHPPGEEGYSYVHHS